MPLCVGQPHSFGLEYRIRAYESVVAPARQIADGETVQVMFDLASNKVVRVPEDLLSMFESYEGRRIPGASWKARQKGP